MIHLDSFYGYDNYKRVELLLIGNSYFARFYYNNILINEEYLSNMSYNSAHDFCEDFVLS